MSQMNPGEQYKQKDKKEVTLGLHVRDTRVWHRVGLAGQHMPYLKDVHLPQLWPLVIVWESRARGIRSSSFSRKVEILIFM